VGHVELERSTGDLVQPGGGDRVAVLGRGQGLQHHQVERPPQNLGVRGLFVQRAMNWCRDLSSATIIKTLDR
jgi:hypothetical protein